MEATKERLTIESGSRFIGKTFLYMLLALLLTAVVGVGVGLIFQYLFKSASVDETLGQYALIYFAVLIVSVISLLVIGIWFNISAIRGKHSLVVPFTLYAFFMGLLMSFFVLFVDVQTLGLAFGITTVAFGSMTAIGLISKRNLGFLTIVVLGLFIGVLVLSLMNLIFYFFVPALFAINYLIIEGLIFLIIMLVTIIDVWQMKKIAESGEANNNLALFCAFRLYIDFIQLLIRVIYILLLAKRR